MIHDPTSSIQPLSLPTPGCLSPEIPFCRICEGKRDFVPVKAEIRYGVHWVYREQISKAWSIVICTLDNNRSERFESETLLIAIVGEDERVMLMLRR